jgi:ribonuclease-3
MMGEGNDPLDELEQLLGHRFADRDLLRQAVRHSSAATATAGGSYQRLEFLGDAVLNHAMAEILYRSYPNRDQGELTRMRGPRRAGGLTPPPRRRSSAHRFVELRPSEEAAMGWRRRRCSRMLEALVGALALDAGWQAALEFVAEQFGDELGGLDERTLAWPTPRRPCRRRRAAASAALLPRARDRGPDQTGSGPLP